MSSFQIQMHELSTYHILSLKPFSLLVIIPIIITIFQAFIFLKLSTISIGSKINNNKAMLLSIILAIFVHVTRIFIGVPFHIFINVFAVAIIISIITKIGLLKSLIGTIFAQITVIISSMIIIEPIFMWGNEKILHYTFTNVIGYSIGLLCEIIVPTIILFVFIKYKIVLFGRARKGKDFTNERLGK